MQKKIISKMCLLFTLSVTYNHTSLLQICDLNVKNYIVSIVIHVYTVKLVSSDH